MDVSASQLTRRNWLKGAAALAAASTIPRVATAASPKKQAMIAITLDLEMSRNFPSWEATHWDYEKGNLNDETKRYAVAAAERVKAAGGVIHFFAVGRVFEQPDVSWLEQLVREGHSVGNHTYDHVNVRARRVEDLQFRFQRAPWLLRGQSPAEAIRENILLTNLAMKERLGISPAGFRTPGGFADGLKEFPDVRAVLEELGFDWVSSLYPPHPNTQPMQEPDGMVLDGIVAALPKAQPFVYSDGLIEIPMSPISDIGAFRTGRWKLDSFLRAIRLGVEWAIERGAVFDFLCHPSCMYVTDPEFKTIDLICDLVRQAGDRAALVDLGTIARHVRDSARAGGE